MLVRIGHRTSGGILIKRRRHGSSGIHSSVRQSVQRLLWSGSVLDQASSRLKEVPKDWLLAMGMQDDVEQGLSFQALAASHSHTLLAYKTLPPSLPVQHVITGQSSHDDEPPRTNPHGLYKIAAIGRNTYGELGLGFSSQESTWGMVSRGFEGTGGIQALQCGLGTSWVVRGKEEHSSLISFGNHTSGQLGHGGDDGPYALSEGGEPQLKLYSSPREVDVGPGYIEAIASGLDHTIVLLNVHGAQQVLTCGINTDGQLGDPDVRISAARFRHLQTFDPPLPAVDEDRIVGVSAGGDTSALWTQSGRVWAWGNSEYGQALVGGGKAIDRIEVPTEAKLDFRVADLRLGGSFVVVLDDAGNVYTAGFGALGQGKDNLSSLKPRRILENASQIHAGLEQASAVVHSASSSSTKLAVWGLDSAAGRLGLGARKPYPSYMLASRFTPDDVELRIYRPVLASGVQDHVKLVVHGREAMFVLVEDGKEEVGRWQPPPPPP